mgnify:FL=1
MKTEHVLFLVLVVLVVVSGIQVFQIRSVQTTMKENVITGNAVSAASSTSGSVNGNMDTTGWTENEIMNYDMHGTIPAKYQTRNVKPSTGSGMVGGC